MKHDWIREEWSDRFVCANCGEVTSYHRLVRLKIHEVSAGCKGKVDAPSG